MLFKLANVKSQISVPSYAAIDSLDDSWFLPLGYAMAIPEAQEFPKYQSFIRYVGKKLSLIDGLGRNEL